MLGLEYKRIVEDKFLKIRIQYKELQFQKLPGNSLLSYPLLLGCHCQEQDFELHYKIQENHQLGDIPNLFINLPYCDLPSQFSLPPL